MKTMTSGYYRLPTIADDRVVFCCEDDLWSVSAEGGIARRLTANPGLAFHPALSPDGAWLAYSSRDEGAPEVFVMPAEGGPAERLTFLGSQLMVIGWSKDGSEILFASNHRQPFARQYALYAVARSGGEPRQLPTGPAMAISYGPTGGAVIARYSTDLARWKRYRGGLTGEIWIDRAGEGDWQQICGDLRGNLASPLWVGERIFFISDHEGVGNLYSVTPSGEDLRQHTAHRDFYVRHPSSDGQRIVYHAGADLYCFDPERGASRLIAIELRSPQAQRKRRFVDADEHLGHAALHPQGRELLLTSRGQSFQLGLWDGAAQRYGAKGARTRLATFLHDGERIALISDHLGEETLEIHQRDGTPTRYLDDRDIGRPIVLVASPCEAKLALTNQRGELLLIDLDEEMPQPKLIDRSQHQRIGGVAWSPDGRWLAYGFADSEETSIIRLYDVANGTHHDATKRLLYDTLPAFDPDGYFLYFISYRDFEPVADAIQFELSFPQAARPCLIILRNDLPSPFAPPPAPLPKEDKAKEEEPKEEEPKEDKAAAPPPKGPKPIRIDLEGLSERVLAFPVGVGNYGRIMGISGKALFSHFELQLNAPRSGQSAVGSLEVYDFAERQRETLLEGVSDFGLSADAKTLIYRSRRRLRVLKAGEKPRENGEPSRRSGWIDLDRLRLAVDPPAEWRQMYREAWRLQRDHFWHPEMGGVDWQAVYRRYLPLLDRVACRGEFSDLLWEMQGELGTSHAYESGGDYRRQPYYRQGQLGLDLRYDAEHEHYLVERIVVGDRWDGEHAPPLALPGIGLAAGDRLVAIDGQALSRIQTPGSLLVDRADHETALRFFSQQRNEERTVTIKPLVNETSARYRDWVEANRRTVHTASGGQLGYLHIPDMGRHGYAEFHRGFLAEVSRMGLIVDVRYNGGGNVSQLLIEKLARRRIGYDISRWMAPSAYPSAALLGPLIGLTNEYAGSDGDIFSHVFKLLKLGPLIGRRTWGGVVGISPLDRLIDGGSTTQPEYSFWFPDVGWGVENYGTEPTIDVVIRPQEYVAGRDPQLERAISEGLRLISEQAFAPLPPTR